MPTSRPLGVNQVAVLRAINEHGGYPGGWKWDTDSGTRKILETLVQRGLVARSGGSRYGSYVITDAGRQAVAS